MDNINSLITSIDCDNWFDIIPVIADALEEEGYLACSRICRFISSRRVKPTREPKVTLLQYYHSMDFKGYSGDSLPTDMSHRFSRILSFTLTQSFKTSLALCCIDEDHKAEKTLSPLPFSHPEFVMSGSSKGCFYSVFPEPGETALNVVLSQLSIIDPNQSRNAGIWSTYKY